MTPETFIQTKAAEAIKSLYGADVEQGSLQVQVTRKEFEGDYTLVVFPLLKVSHSSPENTGKAIGEWLRENVSEIAGYNCVKGFLNISFSPLYWNELFNDILSDNDFGQLPSTGQNIMVEFSSPNTNKPLHLGHIRNNLLGDSVSRLLKACGNNVMKVTLVNDRGVHICKSMLAWLKAGNGITPENSGKKGDHLVGDCYVAFNDIYKKEVDELVAGGMTKDQAEKEAPSLKEAHEMLVKWEEGDKDVRELWKTMNGWVMDGFDKTYRELGISFDKTYFESETYLLGKELVQKGLDMGVFVKDPDGSVWCDLTADGLDRKLLLRSDGTSVYMTQDLGTAERRFSEYKLDSHVYVVGNEQNYHFQVLKLILGKLGFKWADDIFHLSYGMVELPEGKMKSREGTVVDADDLLEQMYDEARKTSEESGKLADMSDDEKAQLYRMIGLGALKYFIIKVDPKKTMLFNPKESIDFNGNTGPFIQYTHARIKSILRKADDQGISHKAADVLASIEPSAKETRLIKLLSTYPAKVAEAGAAYSPAVIANYAYDLAKEFNQYYHDTRILQEEDQDVRRFRLVLIQTVAEVLVKAMDILGIQLPERM
ncbi:MAG: arginine--tRNA ligase [Candidatus Cryptobacteroides sp.]|nr:arginine--tRNA ligase [Bacteroidales bacterium]MDY2859667.1 arginine--tRNA ligase [Candidatus Cryptobacteroides sp.]MDD7083305.1 arginine--tRNA ligase [Bacteroidales bacterium]MDY5262056.1 arginine--tRNA ligase [Candidatus Cryptobacteroides sp.]MDY5571079.1 arginine--tRNA ligase [Candidatus Cryptobacteroides sp.]